MHQCWGHRHAIALPRGSGTTHNLPAKNQLLERAPVPWPRRPDASGCRKLVDSRRLQFHSHHFCASARHLCSHSQASEQSWNRHQGGSPHNRFRRARSSVRQARLTSLSAGCLSSYLIFPPVPVTHEATSSFALRSSPARGGSSVCRLEFHH